MSVYRQINGKNNDREFLVKKYEYITDPVKTSDGTLVGAYACLSKHGIGDWLTVKKAYHKSGGKQGEHIVLSLTPDKKATQNKVYLDVAAEIADCLFHRYNCIYAVHTDSKNRHIHFLINSVSFTDGKRFHSSKADLATTRATVNRVLERHGFDIIRSNTEDMVDDTPYDLENGFEVLEITDDKPDERPFVNALVDASDDEDFIRIAAAKNSSEGNLSVQDYYEREYIPMMNNNSICGAPGFTPTPLYPQPVQQPIAVPAAMQPPMPQPAQAVPAVNGETLYSQPASLPTMTLNFAPTVTVNVPLSVTSDELKSYLNAATPRVNSSSCLKCAVAMADELAKRSIAMNIEANLFPNIVLNISSTDVSGAGGDDPGIIDL